MDVTEPARAPTWLTKPVQGTLSEMTPSALGNGDAEARPGTGRTQIIHSGAARTARPTGQNSRHIGREDGEQSFRHMPCFTGFAVVRA
jgi:hypothetical protein